MHLSPDTLLELERIEASAWEDMARAAPPQFAAAIGLDIARLGGPLFFMAARIPQFQFNWLSGLGLNGDDGASITTALDRFRVAHQQRFFVHVPPGPKADRMRTLARDAGLVAHPLSWAKFHRPVADPPRVETSLEVREVAQSEKSAFAETAIAGFGMPAPMATWLAELVGRPRWHTYLAFDGALPTSAAALYVDGAFAWLGIGATRPDSRKRGGQSALLARRIADAAKFGARHAVTETGVPQPGIPAPSYKNIGNAGFALAYVRDNWCLPEQL